jgi:hypothetical protein
MGNVPSRPLALIAAVLAVLAPAAAHAQAGFYVTPSFSAEEVYDDNIFSAPSSTSSSETPAPSPTPPPVVREEKREDDFITRLVPGLEAGYRSEPFTLLGSYFSQADIFASHSDLTQAQAGQSAYLESRYLPTRALTLSTNGSYVETQQPRNLNAVASDLPPPSGEPLPGTNVGTGLEGRRSRTTRVTVRPEASYKWDPVDSGRAGFLYTRTEQSGTRATEASPDARLDHRFGERDVGDLGYAFRRFDFHLDLPPQAPPADGSPPPEPTQRSSGSTDSHLVTVGLKHDFTTRLRAELRAGPRYTEGSVDPEAFAEIQYGLEQGALLAGYSRTQATVAGETEPVETETFSGGARYEPIRSLLTQLQVGFSRNSTDAGSDVKVYSASLGAAYRVRKWLTFRLGYVFSFQRGSFVNVLSTTTRSDADILHNTVQLGLELSYPYRLY